MVTAPRQSTYSAAGVINKWQCSICDCSWSTLADPVGTIALTSCAGNRRRKVSQVAGDFGHDQELLSALESLGLEEEALRRDKITGDTSTIEDDAAQRRLYARAFEEWAAGKIDGTAQDVFHAVTSILAGDG
jgi:hypothetical protein